MYHSTPCVTSRHQECEDKACWCACHKRKAASSTAIQVLYSCDKCGIKDAVITLACRDSSTSVLEWMETVSTKIGQDHSMRSPLCRAETTQIKIPVDGADYIGGPTKPKVM